VTTVEVLFGTLSVVAAVKAVAEMRVAMAALKLWLGLEVAAPWKICYLRGPE
jgi:hypothetical protein